MLLLLLSCAPAPPPLAEHTVYANARDALAAVFTPEVKVLAIGELHANTEIPGHSTLTRFTDELLPALAPRTTDLVLETWRLDGRCGEREVEVTVTVQEETHRPAETESDLVRAARTAQELGVRPHDLAFSCDEYAALLDETGEVAWDRLLVLLTSKMQDLALQSLEVPDARLVIYGGAVHNDLYPQTSAWTFGPTVKEKAGSGYLELDLYDPALLRRTPSLVEPGWAPLLEMTGPDRVILIPRGPGSYVMLLST